jgi:alkyl sulfatase BDS1-like metallo-beta-lactamase superfamily hydrolase
VIHVCPHCGERLQLVVRKPSDRPRYDHDQALALLAMGATVSEVADTFGVTRQAISALKGRVVAK